MKRRLAKLAVFILVLPLAIRGADALADRLEADHGPTTPSKMLRRGSNLGRAFSRYGR